METSNLSPIFSMSKIIVNSTINIDDQLTGLSTSILQSATITLLFAYLIRCTYDIYRLPPGPIGFPIVGALPLLRNNPHLTIQSWWKKYGDVCCLRMGSRLVVILNSVEMMKECFINKAEIFSSRPNNFFKKLANNKGIVFTEGTVWKEHRKFTKSVLRDFGMGKASLEHNMSVEVDYFLSFLKEKMDKDGNVNMAINLSKLVSNIISAIIYGARFDYDDPVFKSNIKSLEISVRKQTMIGLVNFIPILEYLVPYLPKNKVLLKNVEKRNKYAQEQINKNRKVQNDSARNFIEAYFQKMDSFEKSGISTTFEESQLKRTIQDLFISGTETVTTTLRWCFLLMATYVDSQDKVFEEIDRVLGDRKPTMRDRSYMPITMATIMECQRIGNIALFSVPRMTTTNTKLNGYTIPQGTWVFVNRWGVHRTDRYWKEPNEFKPDRFIQNGVVNVPSTFIPFGMGPRNCIGESLAKTELFMFFTSILQRYRIQPSTLELLPNLNPCVGLNMSPKNYSVQLKLR